MTGNEKRVTLCALRAYHAQMKKIGNQRDADATQRAIDEIEGP